MAKSTAINSLDYLLKPAKHALGAVCIVYGDETFLKREVLSAIRHQTGGDEAGGNEEDDFSLSVFSGREAEWKDVRDALSTVSLFGSGQPTAMIDDADTFVTRYRGELENYIASHVAKQARGLLVLEVRSWPSNTRLAKAVAALSTGKKGIAIECKTPTEARAKRWLTDWAKREHDVKLQSAAVDVLWEQVPPELGILQQELAKLALLVGDSKTITADSVEKNVGSWRTRTAWEMIDAIAAGNARVALEQLERLTAAGEEPIGLLAQLASTLRRFATAAQLVKEGEARGQRLSLKSVLERAGVKPFKLRDAEGQLRQIGRDRAMQLHQWLLDIDLAMKSHSSERSRARIELERLIVRLSRSSASGAKPKSAAGR